MNLVLRDAILSTASANSPAFLGEISRAATLALGNVRCNTADEESPTLILLSKLANGKKLSSLSLGATQLCTGPQFTPASLALKTALQDMSSLAELTMDSSCIGPPDRLLFALSSAATTQLVSLRLVNIPLSPDSVALLAASWRAQAAQRATPTLQRLSLVNNALGDNGVGQLCSGLSALKHLNTLEILHNRVFDGGLVALAAALSHLQQLQDLAVNCSIGRQGGHALARAFHDVDVPVVGHDSSHSTSCEISAHPDGSCHQNGRSRRPSDASSSASHVSSAQSSVPQQPDPLAHRSSHTASRPLTAHAASGPSPVLSAAAQRKQEGSAGGAGHGREGSGLFLSRLVLSSSSMQPRGALALLSGLPLLQYLSHLDLAASDLSAVGLVALSSVLHALPHLEHLVLSHAKAGDPADPMGAASEATSLADAWAALHAAARPCQLRTFVFHEDRSGWAMALVAAGALPMALPSLELLDLSGSMLSRRPPSATPGGDGLAGLRSYPARYEAAVSRQPVPEPRPSRSTLGGGFSKQLAVGVGGASSQPPFSPRTSASEVAAGAQLHASQPPSTPPAAAAPTAPSTPPTHPYATAQGQPTPLPDKPSSVASGLPTPAAPLLSPTLKSSPIRSSTSTIPARPPEAQPLSHAAAVQVQVQVPPLVLRLRTLLLVDVRGLGDREAAAVCCCLQYTPLLQELDLSHNAGLGEGAASALGQVLVHLPHLRRLDLSLTSVGDAAAKALAAKVNGLRSLQEVCMEDCGVTPEGAEPLVLALIHARHITRFSSLALGSRGYAHHAAAGRDMAHVHFNRGVEDGPRVALQQAWAVAPHLAGASLALTVYSVQDVVLDQQVAAAAAAAAERQHAALTAKKGLAARFGFGRPAKEKQRLPTAAAAPQVTKSAAMPASPAFPPGYGPTLAPGMRPAAVLPPGPSMGPGPGLRPAPGFVQAPGGVLAPAAMAHSSMAAPPLSGMVQGMAPRPGLGAGLGPGAGHIAGLAFMPGPGKV